MMCNINLNSDPLGSESERFIRIRIWIRILQNVRIRSDSDLDSDSDPQHCMVVQRQFSLKSAEVSKIPNNKYIFVPIKEGRKFTTSKLTNKNTISFA